MPNHLFVYGTLHPERAPVEIKKDVKKMRLVGKGTVPGKLVDLGDFPGAVLGKQFRRLIPGLVFSLPENDPKLLARLDRYEEFFAGAPEQSLFLRKQVDVSLDDATEIRCWIYEWNRAKVEPVAAASLSPEAVPALP